MATWTQNTYWDLWYHFHENSNLLLLNVGEVYEGDSPWSGETVLTVPYFLLVVANGRNLIGVWLLVIAVEYNFLIQSKTIYLFILFLNRANWAPQAGLELVISFPSFLSSIIAFVHHHTQLSAIRYSSFAVYHTMDEVVKINWVKYEQKLEVLLKN
jgi:hypothetical protein